MVIEDACYIIMGKQASKAWAMVDEDAWCIIIGKQASKAWAMGNVFWQ